MQIPRKEFLIHDPSSFATIVPQLYTELIFEFKVSHNIVITLLYHDIHIIHGIFRFQSRTTNFSCAFLTLGIKLEKQMNFLYRVMNHSCIFIYETNLIDYHKYRNRSP